MVLGIDRVDRPEGRGGHGDMAAESLGVARDQTGLLEARHQHIGAIVGRFMLKDRPFEIVDEPVRLGRGRGMDKIRLGIARERKNRQADIDGPDHLHPATAQRMGDGQSHQASPVGDDHPSPRQINRHVSACSPVHPEIVTMGAPRKSPTWVRLGVRRGRPRGECPSTLAQTIVPRIFLLRRSLLGVVL